MLIIVTKSIEFSKRTDTFNLFVHSLVLELTKSTVKLLRKPG